ncbi:MAG: aminoacetone oxidase family FAD-binding enzyme [Candidatus Omnitrophota bacterium]
MIYDAAIIGAGPAGLSTAIIAAQNNKKVILLEKQKTIGRKIAVTGAGRCNLLNDALSEAFYNKSAQFLVKSIFSKFGKDDILKFFKDLGLNLYSDAGRIFPLTNQASTVTKIFGMWLDKLVVPVEFDFEVSSLSKEGDSFFIKAKNSKSMQAKKVILASGGKTYPALSSIDSLYKEAVKFGHSAVMPVPACVPLVAKDPFCHFLQGQKIFAAAICIIDNQVISRDEGELLFTKYGLSGTLILDISEPISIAINRQNKKEVYVEVDLIPFLSIEELECELEKRFKNGFKPQDLLSGILPNKFSKVLAELLDKKNTKRISTELKAKRFKIIGTRGWNEAEFTCGGINVNEVDKETLESKLKKNLYFAGEILDVTGKRGGYNLAWAWASGAVCGKNV